MTQQEKEPRNLFESLPGCLMIPFALVSRALRRVEAWADLTAYMENEKQLTGKYPDPIDPQSRA